MEKLGLQTEIVDQSTYRGSIERFREAGIALPTGNLSAFLEDPRQRLAYHLVVVGQDNANRIAQR